MMSLIEKGEVCLKLNWINLKSDLQKDNCIFECNLVRVIQTNENKNKSKLSKSNENLYTNSLYMFICWVSEENGQQQ